MKKMLMLLISLIFLGGCSVGENSSPPVPDFNFVGNMSVTYNNFDINCEIENVFADMCVVRITDPELLSGLTITLKDGICTFSLDDISYEMDSAFAEKAEFLSAFSESTKQILKSAEYKKLENGNWLYSGMTNSGKFFLIQDSLSGYPVSFRIPEARLSITFSNMKSIDNGG